MDETTLRKALVNLPIVELRFFDSLGSTNDEASRWAAQGAPEYSLVVANEQTAGRGREGHQWHSPPGISLAFSLVIRPKVTGPHVLPRLTALGALAVHDALLNKYDLPSQIKWPNDVLIQGRKVAGILAEANWDGDRLDAVVLGIGINIGEEAPTMAEKHEGPLHFPATSVSIHLGRPVDPVELLQAVLAALVAWRPRVASQDFITAWESNLAFRGETVQIAFSESAGKDGLPSRLENRPPALQEGRIVGLAQDGSLKLRLTNGETVNVRFGEVRLRPVSS
jgi:BirA family biotin operon repressor/biotin-[acetyl-CoA-carboxylase] ligase